MNFEPRNVLITGGAGFIGANFVRHWLARGGEGRVVVFDALTYAGNLDSLAGLERDPRYLFVKGDICDEAAVRALLEQQRIDTVVHFAQSRKSAVGRQENGARAPLSPCLHRRGVRVLGSA